jgi:ArsR family transcriptional regulator
VWEVSVINTMSAASVKARADKPLDSNDTPVKVPDKVIRDLAEVFKLLGDQSRLKILLALAEQGEMHVGALCEVLGGAKPASQPAVSHHLSLMRAHNLVNYRRDGKNNFYRIDSAALNGLLDMFFDGAGNAQRQLQFEEFSLVYKRK